MKAALGLDFGTESERAVLVDLLGDERASAEAKYRQGQITESLPGTAPVFKPIRANRANYDGLYREYHRLAEFLSTKGHP